jgi:thioredoxin-dependent peroxiredoxin
MAELKEGDRAPEIRATADDGSLFELSRQTGRKVVLYFYPKADTPGCTKEACGFRDAITELAELNGEVVGVSPDTPEAQAKFKAKHNLPFTLLADADHRVAEAYGVWKEKSMYGRKYMGVERTTFVIDEQGRIARIFRKVKPEGHSREVMAALG